MYPVLCGKKPKTQLVLSSSITPYSPHRLHPYLLGGVSLQPFERIRCIRRILEIPDPQKMTVARLIHWSTPKRRKAVTYLFALTFFASVVTVSASNGLPCPARHDRRAYLDSEDNGTGSKNASVHIVEKKQRRWIQETRPTPTGHWPT